MGDQRARINADAIEDKMRQTTSQKKKKKKNDDGDTERKLFVMEKERKHQFHVEYTGARAERETGLFSFFIVKCAHACALFG